MKIDKKSHIEEPNTMIVGRTTFVAVENHCNKCDCSLCGQCGSEHKKYKVWEILK